jgi:hypothetical protein
MGRLTTPGSVIGPCPCPGACSPPPPPSPPAPPAPPLPSGGCREMLRNVKAVGAWPGAVVMCRDGGQASMRITKPEGVPSGKTWAGRSSQMYCGVCTRGGAPSGMRGMDEVVSWIKMRVENVDQSICRSAYNLGRPAYQLDLPHAIEDLLVE